MLVWLTQLGLSVALPIGGLTALGVWLRNGLGWGTWVLIVCVELGLMLAGVGLRDSLRAMARMDKRNETKERPPVSFNQHE